MESLAVVLLETVFLPDLVGVGEKGLSVVTLFREAARQQGEDELVGVSCCGLAEHLDRRVIKADLVVLDRVAVDADGELEVLVLDGVVARGEVLDLAVARSTPSCPECRRAMRRFPSP